MFHRIALAGTAVVVIALSAGNAMLLGNEEKTAQPDHRHARRHAFAAKLGLSEEQKAEIDKIHTEFAQKSAPARKELGTLHQEQKQAMRKLLTEEQRDKLAGIFKKHWDKKWQSIATQLNLTEEQNGRIEKVRSFYGAKFRELAQRGDENSRDLFRALRREKLHAIVAELNDEQGARVHKLCCEGHGRRSSVARHEFWKGMGEKLALSAEQKEELRKTRTEFQAKIEKPASQLNELRKEKHEAMAKVLTPEQREKHQEMRKSREAGKTPA